jgi:phenylacetate-CoA ligase
MSESLEYEPLDEIESQQMDRLRAMLSFLLEESNNKFYREKLKEVLPSHLKTLSDLPALPFTLKSELVEQQSNGLFSSGNLSYPASEYIKLHQTSGTTGFPLKVFDTAESWDWWNRCWEQVYRAAGLKAGDRIYLAFSYGPFIGFWAAYDGARLLGALAIPGGGLDSEQRLQSILENDVTVLCCTPSYALHMAEVANHKGLDIKNSKVRALIHAGEPGASIPAVRQRIEEQWQARCYDHAGASEVGAWGFSCDYGRGLHLNEAEFIFEVIDPVTGEPLAPGQPGELVITNLGRWGFPVIRYRTGDMVRISREKCPCGRSFRLVEGGIIGRTDNMVVVRGINIYPSSIEAIVREVLETNEFRMIFNRVNDMDEILVEVELAPDDANRLLELNTLFRQRLGLRVPVKPVMPGTLPRYQLKAKRIVDNRPPLGSQ